MRSQLILPRAAGKGDHAKHGGRGLGGATRTASDKPPRRAPPPPRKCAVPLPRCAGADKRQRSRGAALRPSHANHHAQEKTKEGGGAPKDACAIHCPRCNRQHCCYRLRCGRAPNGARSPSGASPRHSPRQSQPALAQPWAVLPGTRLVRRYPPSPVPVKRAPRRPVLVPAERYPEPPGDGVQIRTRAPHPAPRSGMPREHDPQVSEIHASYLKQGRKSMKKRRDVTASSAGLTRRSLRAMSRYRVDRT